MRTSGASPTIFVTDSVGGTPRAELGLVGQLPPGTSLRATSRALSTTIKTFAPGVLAPDTVVVAWGRVDGGPRLMITKPAPAAPESTLWVLNGRVVDRRGPEVRALQMGDIGTTEVLGGPVAGERFGARARYGVVAVTTKAAPEER